MGYTFYSGDISFTDLITQTGHGGPAWLGSALPAIAVIIFALIALLSSIYALSEGVEITRLWFWLGILSAISIIINVTYLFYWMHDYFHEWVNLINPGVVVAFIGAVVIVLSRTRSRKRMSEPMYSESRNNRCRLWAVGIFLTGIAAAITGLIIDLLTGAREEIIKYEQGLYDTTPIHRDVSYQLCNTTESRVLWIIGSILLVIGVIGIYYYTKKHEKVLDSFDE